MGELDDVLHTVERIHAAGVDPTLWPDALTAITRLIGGVGATLELIDRRSVSHLVFHSAGVPAAGDVAYLNYYASRNPRIAAAFQQPHGTIVWDHQVLDENAIDHSEFYADFLAPMDMRYVVAGLLHTEADESGSVAIQRSARQGHVDHAEIAMMARLVPHLSQALDVNRRLLTASAALQHFEQAMDWLADGVVALDTNADVVHTNHAARAMARANDGFTLQRGTVIFTPAANRAFGRALASIRALQNGGSLTGADFTVERPGGKPPYTVSIRPFRQNGVMALLFIHDPLAGDASTIALLSSAFGLTVAEAALASALRAGTPPSIYARTRALSPNTVYTHIRHIKEKCGQTRMVELLRILNDVRTIAAPHPS